jgi:cytolysin-activating lysine-acyltransferase
MIHSLASSAHPAIPAATSWQPKPGGALFGDPLFGAAAADRHAFAAKSSATPAPTDKTVSTVLGEVTWLLTQSPQHKNLAIADLEWQDLQ